MANQQHKIQIGADFSQFIQGVKSTSSALNDLSKDKYKINVDSAFVEKLNIELDKQKSKMESRLNSLMLAQQKIFSKLKDSEKKALDPATLDRYQKGWTNLGKKIEDTAGSLQSLEKSRIQTEQRTVTGEGKKTLQRAIQGATIVGGGIAGLYAMGSSRRGIAQEGLTLMGMGAATNQAQVNRMRVAGQTMGYTPEETLQQSIQLQRQVGGQVGVRQTQLGGRTTLEATQRLARGTGADVNQLIGMGGTFRKMGMTDVQSIRKLEETMAKAQAMGYEKSRASEFAQDQINFLEQINKNGVGSIEAMDQLNSILSGSKFFAGTSPERAAAIRQGVEGLVGAEEGPAALATYQVMSETKTKEGKMLSPVEMLRVKQAGAFGKGGFLETFGAEGLKKITENIGKLTMGSKFTIQSGTKEQKQMLGAIISKFMGIQTSMSDEFLSVLDGTDEKVKEFADKAEKNKGDISGTADSVMGSFDGQIKKVESSLSEFGNKLGELTNSLTNAIGGTGVGISGLIGVGGGILQLLQLLQMRKLGSLVKTSGPILEKGIESAASGMSILPTLGSNLLKFAKFAGAASAIAGLLVPTTLGEDEEPNVSKDKRGKLESLKEKYKEAKTPEEKKIIQKQMQDIFYLKEKDSDITQKQFLPPTLQNKNLSINPITEIPKLGSLINEKPTNQSKTEQQENYLDKLIELSSKDSSKMDEQNLLLREIADKLGGKNTSKKNDIYAPPMPRQTSSGKYGLGGV